MRYVGIDMQERRFVINLFGEIVVSPRMEKKGFGVTKGVVKTGGMIVYIIGMMMREWFDIQGNPTEMGIDKKVILA